MLVCLHIQRLLYFFSVVVDLVYSGNMFGGGHQCWATSDSKLFVSMCLLLWLNNFIEILEKTSRALCCRGQPKPPAKLTMRAMGRVRTGVAWWPSAWVIQDFTMPIQTLQLLAFAEGVKNKNTHIPFRFGLSMGKALNNSSFAFYAGELQARKNIRMFHQWFSQPPWKQIGGFPASHVWLQASHSYSFPICGNKHVLPIWYWQEISSVSSAQCGTPR